MSADLVDMKRLKITAETRAWLAAESHVTGRSAQDIARDVLHFKAMEKIHAAKVITALASGEGHIRDGRVHIGDSQGRGGK
jgi:hypothetical protein